MTKTKRIALVTGHFPPSNLASVHRSRLWAQHLPEFGWTPIIVTAHWDYYEERLDSALLDLVGRDLRVIRTKAFSVKPLRIVGDIGLRALFWHLTVLNELVLRKEIDFFHICIPSHYSALLGEMVYRKHQFPFGIDYIDPWVHVWPGTEKVFSKSWASCKLANLLEPWAVRNASLITGVAPLYYESVLERNPHLREQCITAAMPYGNSEVDYRYLANAARNTFLFPKHDAQHFNMIYAGAMLPNADIVLERFLDALAIMREEYSQLMEQLQIHFVGTGTSPNDPKGYNIWPHVQRYGLDRWVHEHPNRISYVDVLNHLAHASAILILGSTDPHYTPSKIYQAVQAKRPIFALLHEMSTAVNVLHESRAGKAVTFKGGRIPSGREIAMALADFIRDPQYDSESVKWDAFEAYSARNSSRILAEAVDNAIEVFDQRILGRMRRDMLLNE
jgi:hypothetical protein